MTWIVGVVGVILGGLGTTLVRLRHDRESDLRARMLGAADDFVGAYTAAYEAISQALSKVHIRDKYIFDDETSEELRKQWLEERKDAARAAHDAQEALRQRLLRLNLLFGIDSPVSRWAWMCDSVLSLSLHLVPTYALQSDIEQNAAKTDDELRAERERLRATGKTLERFSAEARKAVVASPWSGTLKRLGRAEPRNRDLILWIFGSVVILALAVIHAQ